MAWLTGTFNGAIVNIYRCTCVFSSMSESVKGAGKVRWRLRQRKEESEKWGATVWKLGGRDRKRPQCLVFPLVSVIHWLTRTICFHICQTCRILWYCDHGSTQSASFTSPPRVDSLISSTPHETRNGKLMSSYSVCSWGTISKLFLSCLNRCIIYKNVHKFMTPQCQCVVSGDQNATLPARYLRDEEYSFFSTLTRVCQHCAWF